VAHCNDTLSTHVNLGLLLLWELPYYISIVNINSGTACPKYGCQELSLLVTNVCSVHVRVVLYSVDIFNADDNYDE
jgi:hypothetical protein